MLHPIDFYYNANNGNLLSTTFRENDQKATILEIHFPYGFCNPITCKTDLFDLSFVTVR